MVVDYERAWIRLGELIASKPHHGSKDLAVGMAEIAADCQVPGGTLSRLLRLYGIEVELDELAEKLRDVDPEAGGGSAAPGMEARRDHRQHDDRGGHDGRNTDDGPRGRGGREARAGRARAGRARAPAPA